MVALEIRQKGVCDNPDHHGTHVAEQKRGGGGIVYDVIRCDNCSAIKGLKKA